MHKIISPYRPRISPPHNYTVACYSLRESGDYITLHYIILYTPRTSTSSTRRHRANPINAPHASNHKQRHLRSARTIVRVRHFTSLRIPHVPLQAPQKHGGASSPVSYAAPGTTGPPKRNTKRKAGPSNLPNSHHWTESRRPPRYTAAAIAWGHTVRRQPTTRCTRSA